MKTTVFISSLRKESNTRDALSNLSFEYELVDLLDYKITSYRYEALANDDDDFLALVNFMLDSERIVFATPVYWYAMSSLMKNFFERLTDLTNEYQELGRKLSGKKVMSLSTSSAELAPEGFEVPFKLTSEYFSMDYLGNSHFQYQKIRDNRNEGEKL